MVTWSCCFGPVTVWYRSTAERDLLISTQLGSKERETEGVRFQYPLKGTHTPYPWPHFLLLGPTPWRFHPCPAVPQLVLSHVLRRTLPNHSIRVIKSNLGRFPFLQALEIFIIMHNNFYINQSHNYIFYVIRKLWSSMLSICLMILQRTKNVL